MQQNFNPLKDLADLCILYEVTGFQGKLERDNFDFWETHYGDFEKLSDSNT